jgi:hypothetical protein
MQDESRCLFEVRGIVAVCIGYEGHFLLVKVLCNGVETARTTGQ